MAGAEAIAQFKDAMVFLAAAGIGVPLLQRLKVNPILGFMLAGMAFGPYGLGRFAAQHPWLGWVTINDAAGFEGLGEVGVIFLLFTIGLDVSFARLWTLRRQLFGLGSAQVLATAILLAGALSLAGLAFWPAIVAALGLALSSTAIVIQLLVGRHRFATPEGQTPFAVLLLQDLTVVPILFLVGALAAPHGETMSAQVLNTMLYGTLAVTALLLAGRYVVPAAMKAAGRAGNHEIFLAVVLLVALASAAATGAAGLPTSMGAFLAGAMLAESAFKHQIEADIEPFKGLLLGLFFVWVGMSIDPEFVWSNIGAILTGLAALVAIKAIVLLALGAAFRVPFAISIQVSFLLAHGGEFALILHETTQTLIAVVVLSMTLTAPLDELGRRLGGLVEGRRAERPRLQTADKDGAVIIGGFGRVGQLIAQVLDGEGVPWLALDADPGRVARARSGGMPVFFGDATRKEVLLRAGANRAPVFVVTLDNPQLAERMVRAVHDEWPGTPLVARAKDWKHADHLRSLGVDDVIPEAVEGSLQLAAHVLEGLGLDEDAVIARIAEERERSKTSHE